MEWIYFSFVIFLVVLAISDLWVGVSNDAVNFMNSALGAKAAKFRTIVIVAAVGVFCGAVMSDGMMDIARHGVFRPEQFSFREVMFIFLAVMATDIILLDTFNSLGMPTSTTVSMVFELLGASFAFSLIKMGNNSGLGISDYMNTSQALSMIIAIFASVAIAFIVGFAVQYIARIIFTFHYSPKLKWKIGIFGGIATTSIVYFMLFKGIKHMAFMTPEIVNWIDEHTLAILGICFAVTTAIMQLLYFCKVNVFKVIVLLGTFSLATAFAGNDLINFIGVPLSGISSFADWKAAGAPEPGTYIMDSLNESASTPFIYLFFAGTIMVLALATSKKAQNVSKTEINLAKQEEGEERFGSSKAARSIVRFGNKLGTFFVTVTPQPVINWVNTRFDKTLVEVEDGAAYDLVRASVNLVMASLLIALGTSFKLPLSTTYVTFMIAMSSSLADRAWSRESAVFRVTGVLSVIGGWFITAGVAFISTFIIALLMHWGGMVAAAIIVVTGLAVMIHSNIKFKEKETSESGDENFRAVLKAEDNKTVWKNISKYISMNETQILRTISENYRYITDGVLDDNVKLLRKSDTYLREIKDKMKNIRRKETICIRKMDQETAMTRSAWFFSSFNDLEQMYYSVRRMCEPALEHIDNNFTPLPESYAEDFRKERDLLDSTLKEVALACEVFGYEHMRVFEDKFKQLQSDFSEKRKALTKDIQADKININTAYLYLNILQESETMAIHMKQFIRSSRKFQEPSKLQQDVFQQTNS